MSTAIVTKEKSISPAKGAFLGGVMTALGAIIVGQKFSQAVLESQNLTLVVVGIAFAVGAIAGGLLARKKS